MLRITGATSIWPTRVSHVSYTANGVKFQARIFLQSSGGSAGGAVSRRTKKALTPAALNWRTRTTPKSLADGNRITASGTLDNGLKFEWQVLVLNQGGSVSTVTDTNSARLEFKDCDGLTLLIAAGTDYVFDYAKKYHGEDPHARVTAQIDAAAKKSFAKLKAEHIKDYQALFNRVSADFGQSSAAQTACPRTSASWRPSRRLIPDSKRCCSNTAVT